MTFSSKKTIKTIFLSQVFFFSFTCYHLQSVPVWEIFVFIIFVREVLKTETIQYIIFSFGTNEAALLIE